MAKKESKQTQVEEEVEAPIEVAPETVAAGGEEPQTTLGTLQTPFDKWSRTIPIR